MDKKIATLLGILLFSAIVGASAFTIYFLAGFEKYAPENFTANVAGTPNTSKYYYFTGTTYSTSVGNARPLYDINSDGKFYLEGFDANCDWYYTVKNSTTISESDVKIPLSVFNSGVTVNSDSNIFQAAKPKTASVKSCTLTMLREELGE